MSDIIKFGNKGSHAVYKDQEEEKVVVEIAESKPTETVDINLGLIVIQSAAEAVVHAMTTKPVLGLENTDNVELNALLDRSRFYEIIPNVELMLALHGKTGLAIVKLLNKFYLVQLGVTSYSRIGNLYTEVIATTENTFKEDGVEYQSGYRWYYKGEIAYIETIGIHVPTNRMMRPENTTNKPLDEIFDNVIPVDVLFNIERPVPDWKRAESLAINLNFHSNQTKPEWEFTKTMFNMNGNFGGDSTTHAVQQAILAGERGLSNSTLASKIRAPLEGLPMSAGALPINLAMVDSFEDKLLKYMFALRDSISSGTNKHNTEVATFNQLAADMVQYKVQRFRNRQYTNFFRMHVSKIIKDIKKIDIKFQVSDIEKYKIEGMNPNAGQGKGGTPAKKDGKEEKT